MVFSTYTQNESKWNMKLQPPKVAKVQGPECLLAEMGMQLSIAN